MFKLFRKKKPVMSRIFGEVKYSVKSWKVENNITINLFEQDYLVSVWIMTESEEQKISELQENTFIATQKILNDRKDEIERFIMEHFAMESIAEAKNRFMCSLMVITVHGECALSFRDNTGELGSYEEYCDYYDRYALFVMPKFKILYYEEIEDYFYCDEFKPDSNFYTKIDKL